MQSIIILYKKEFIFLKIVYVQAVQESLYYICACTMSPVRDVNLHIDGNVAILQIMHNSFDVY